MITLQKLQWNNCFSYGEGNEIMLDERTLTQILGTNGMGKSSIPLIIEEALYNKNSKGIKKADIPNRYVNNGYDIVLDFTRDTDEYRITVNRKTNVKVKFEKNGEDISLAAALNNSKSSTYFSRDKSSIKNFFLLVSVAVKNCRLAFVF